MKLGDIARVSRGIATGDRALYIMTKAQAAERGLEAFVRVVIVSARELPRSGAPVVRDSPDRRVVLVASGRDIEAHPNLRRYLGDRIPRIVSVHPSPVIVTYVGVPRFAANPDGLVVTNSFYCLRPRQHLTKSQVLGLVARLNAAAGALGKSTGIRYSPRSLEALDV